MMIFSITTVLLFISLFFIFFIFVDGNLCHTNLYLFMYYTTLFQLLILLNCAIGKKRIKDNNNNKLYKKKEKIERYGLTLEEIEKFEVIKAFDPGVINMYCGGSGVDKDGKEIINKLTSKKYYHDCGFNQATFQRNKIYKDNPTIWEALNKIPSHTTVDIEEYEEYVKYNMLNVTELIKFHMDKKFFRKMKFTNYIKKQKKFEVSTFIYYKTYQFLIQYIYIYYII